MPKRLELSDVSRMRRLFEKKNWDKHFNEETIFSNFCTLLDNLNPEQKELIHELAENYLWLASSEYEIKYHKIFTEIFNKFLKDCKKVYLIPLLKPSDRNKTKSAKHCVYLVKGILNLSPQFSDIEILIVDDFDILKKNKYGTDGSEVFFLIDDFVGTGDTFEKAWVDISKNKSITIDNTILISLVFQTQGYEFIKSKFGMKIFYYELRTKGISDFFSSPLKEEKIRIMSEIEKIIEPSPSYAFGYRGSEALVTMIRTPNNTFPVFWKKYTISDQKYTPPFLRN